MLYWATSLLQSYYSGFRVFHYLTFRAILAVLTSLLIALLAGPAIIRYLNRIKVGQIVRDDGPKDHLKKVGTPTMGGVLILIAVTISTCLWSDLNQYCVWIVLGVMLGFGCIGGLDDYYKLARQHSRGLSVKQKLGWQSLIALIVALFLYQHEPFAQQIYLVVPFVKETYLELGWLFLILTYFVVVGTSNAVNLTDGLDGLAIMPVVLVSGALAIFAYVAGNVAHAKYLGVPYIAGSGELVIFCAGLVGSGLGFLWFNSYPAQIFMGDVGALSLGAANKRTDMPSSIVTLLASNTRSPCFACNSITNNSCSTTRGPRLSNRGF